MPLSKKTTPYGVNQLLRNLLDCHDFPVEKSRNDTRIFNF